MMLSSAGNKVGRNDACPCGSGKKYKHCCLPGYAPSVDRLWERQHEESARLTRDITRFAERKFGERIYDAWQDFNMSDVPPSLEAAHAPVDRHAHEVGREILALFGRALAIRAVDAGSCNGCELEMHALANPYYNIEGIGIRFVASPRHADLLLVTGPVSVHMELALRRTYEAVPAPKRVVAIGACACDGGVFGESYASRGRIANVIPVDVEVAGCPPAPVQILRGILRAVRGD